MRMKLSAQIFAFSAVIILFGCASPRLTVKQVGHSKKIISTPTIKYNDFYEAIFHFDFDYLKNYKATNDQSLYANAIQTLITGNVDESVITLKRLLDTKFDTVIYQNSKALLENILLMEYRWEEFLKYHPDPINSTDIFFSHAKAFNTQNKEYIQFPTTPVTMPIKFEQGGQPLVEVVVNGHVKWFIFDTGAQFSVVSDQIVEECGVTELDGTFKGASKNILSKPGIISDIEFGGISIRNHPVMIIKSKDLDIKFLGMFSLIKIDGIIGWPLIKKMEAHINYKNSTALFLKPKQKDALNRNLFYYYRPFVTMKTIDGIPIHLHLDTGNDQTFLTQKVLRRIDLGNIKNSLSVTSKFNTSSISKNKKISNFAILFNDYEFLFNEINIVDGPAFYDGIIGADLLSNGKITIDDLNGYFNFELVNNE